ncbi:hypothetical protein [Amycolatopsis thailandensis]|nr:hypothetical protein [Amycolatopsis thailandensis]
MSEAATELTVAPSAISRQIAELEAGCRCSSGIRAARC